ncbi:MAG: dTDP-glucose 4,6-dehydratase [Candidatus Doudnabacteria bacterium]|nr:dTDP-glucose 4,6-dehydratase [Candidatus Doudnabacteria bacterium]
MNLNSQTILVTGGAGFIGSNFVHYWLKNYPGDKLIVLDKLTYAGNLENLQNVADKVHFIKGDICDAGTVDEAVKNADIVVHFAAESHVDRSILEPDEFVRTNVLGTHTLLKFALKYEVKRFHHVSTDEVFGQLPLDSKEKWNENTPYNPRSPYSASKAGSDHLVRAYHTTYNLPITITNCSNNIGPYMFPEKFLPLAITNLMESKKVPVYGPGNQVREWLHVEDHCSAIDMVLKKGQVGETYFVGPDNEEFSNLQVLKKVIKLMGKAEDGIEFVKDRPGHDQKYAIDHSKITRELGWKPKYNLEQTLVEMIEWYKANEKWWRRVKSGEYREYYNKQYNQTI